MFLPSSLANELFQAACHFFLLFPRSAGDDGKPKEFILLVDEVGKTFTAISSNLDRRFPRV